MSNNLDIISFSGYGCHIIHISIFIFHPNCTDKFEITFYKGGTRAQQVVLASVGCGCHSPTGPTTHHHQHWKMRPHVPAQPCKRKPHVPAAVSDVVEDGDEESLELDEDVDSILRAIHHRMHPSLL